MNIVLITDLYPAFPDHSPNEISHAVHRFARQWIREHNVLVVRPHLFPGKTARLGNLKTAEFRLDDVSVLNVPVLKIPKLRIFFLRKITREISRRVRPDVIIAHLGFNLLIGHRIAASFDVPLISALHNGDFRFGMRMLSQKTLKMIYRNSAGIACRSELLLNKLLTWAPELGPRCFTIPSGIEAEMIVPEPFAAAKIRAWKESGTTVFLTACQLIRQKRIDINLIALADLPKEIHWQYRILGAGPERNRLKQLAAKLGIAPRVHFPGRLPRREVIREMRASHVFLMVSANETFGLAYLEALATANIVVAAAGTGIDGIIRHGKNGFLCIPGDAGQLRAIVEKICLEITAPEKSEMISHARATVRGLSEEQAAHHYLDHVRQALAQ